MIAIGFRLSTVSGQAKKKLFDHQTPTPSQTSDFDPNLIVNVENMTIIDVKDKGSIIEPAHLGLVRKNSGNLSSTS